MTLMFVLLGLSMATELLAYAVFRAKLVRWSLALLSIMLMMYTAAALAFLWPNSLSVLILVVSGYRAFNCVRMVKGRMHPAYLQRATRGSGIYLIAIQLAVAALWWVWLHSALRREAAWTIAVIVQLVAAGVLLLSFRRRLDRTRPPRALNKYMDAQLPSLTVAIPARNETDDLQQCLESLIANDYPKLEILVLDDCSQNKRTPEIIRSFAHAGVRFVEGEEPRFTWLPKNQACDRLLQEASGEYILFCGVDVRFQPSSLRTLVTILMRKKKSMISVIPLRQVDKTDQRSVVQSMRYWWELVPPRRLFQRPAVLSTCWLAQRSALTRIGGFAAVARAIVPEAYFAKAMTVGDRYSFMRSDRSVGIASTKAVSEQWDTAVRMRYPQLHRRPEQVFWTSLAELFFLGLPFGITFFGWWRPIRPLAHFVALLAAILLVWCYAWMCRATHLVSWPAALFALPGAVLADIFIAHRSMWLYEFSDVQWKDRNVCIPVMHTYPHLPAE